jgi:hypothetical protein
VRAEAEHKSAMGVTSQTIAAKEWELSAALGQQVTDRQTDRQTTLLLTCSLD